MSEPPYAGLLERLLGPRVWCCIFEHEGQMRHGTTDAPIKAAEAISSLLKRVGELETAIQMVRNDAAIERNEQLVAHCDAALNSDASTQVGGE